jgi:hypothetical protein
MKKRLFVVSAIGVAALTLILSAPAAAVPLLVNYQGQLLDGGRPVDGTVQMTFALYGDPSGGGPLWSETQSVSLSSGVYSVLLGSVAPLSPDTFGPAGVYLGVTIDAAGGGEEMSPRLPIVSTGYAFRAARAEAVDVETDPQVGALAADKWCTSDGAQVNCLADPPLTAAGGTVTGLLTVDGTVSATAFTGSGASLDGVDKSDTNELNTAVVLSGTTLEVTDGGGTKGADLAAIDTDTLAGLSCAEGEVAVFDGSVWGCGAGSSTGGSLPACGSGPQALNLPEDGHASTPAALPLPDQAFTVYGFRAFLAGAYPVVLDGAQSLTGGRRTLAYRNCLDTDGVVRFETAANQEEIEAATLTAEILGGSQPAPPAGSSEGILAVPGLSRVFTNQFTVTLTGSPVAQANVTKVEIDPLLYSDQGRLPVGIRLGAVKFINSELSGWWAETVEGRDVRKDTLVELHDQAGVAAATYAFRDCVPRSYHDGYDYESSGSGTVVTETMEMICTLPVLTTQFGPWVDDDRPAPPATDLVAEELDAIGDTLRTVTFKEVKPTRFFFPRLDAQEADVPAMEAVEFSSEAVTIQ